MFTLPVKRYAQIRETIDEAHEAEFHEKQVITSFGAWQTVIATLAAAGAKQSDRPSFGKYAEALGLAPSSGETKQEVQARIRSEKDAALAKARRVQEVFAAKGSREGTKWP